MASSSDAATTAAAATPEVVVPPLVDDAGAPLPQTEERPSVDDPSFRLRIARLFEAIVADAPEHARDAFFPVEAYRLVKAIPNPAADWEHRLIGAFRRDIHVYHRKLGAHADRAKFVRLELPEARATWMKPGSEGNKLGYYRVLGSRLVWADEDGREHVLDVTSFISWRGQWYVVHLQGFR